MPVALYTGPDEWLAAVAARFAGTGSGASIERTSLDGASLEGDGEPLHRVAVALAGGADARGELTQEPLAVARALDLQPKTVRRARVALIDAGLLVYLERRALDGGAPQRLQLQLPRRSGGRRTI